MSARVDILLPVYNGRKYLPEQLASFKNQTEKSIRLILRDDGSGDGGIDESLFRDGGLAYRILPERDHRGVVASYNALLAASDAPYVMFSDQDDVWNSDKVSKSLERLMAMEAEYGSDTPLLCFSDLAVVDEKLKLKSPSYFDYQKIDPLRNRLNQLLLQNTGCGCTMIFNQAMKQLVGIMPEGTVMHDHFFMLTAACFGKISFIDEALMLYRQHGRNVYGASRYGWKYFFRRGGQGWHSIRKRFYQNVEQGRVFLDKYSSLLNTADRRMLEDFVSLPGSGFITRRKILLKHRIFKATFLRNLGSMLIV